MRNLNETLKKQISELPEKPGAYIYYDQNNKVIYVGKAVNIKNRVRSYFHSPESLGPKTSALVASINSVQYIEVESEIEALLLEAELIKRYRPRYNIVLKDDKSYLYIKITTNEEIPRVSTARREHEQGATYFGPFPSARTTKNVLKIIRKIFPYRSCKTLPKKPCLFYHIKLCSAPCVGYITREKYNETIQQIILFLKGKRKKLEQEITTRMRAAIKTLNFEEAARYKKQLDEIHYITQVFRDPQDYIENPNLKEDEREKTLQELKEVIEKFIQLPAPPKRIECYDISNTQGQQAVGAMVVFTQAQPDKQEYRKFKIKTKETPDDVSMLKEVLERRFNHNWARPDLIVIDGGKGQLQSALDVINNRGLHVPVIALAKKHEEIVVKQHDKFHTIKLPRNSKALQMLQHLRDEAHRFGITFHRTLRAKKTFKINQ